MLPYGGESRAGEHQQDKGAKSIPQPVSRLTAGDTSMPRDAGFTQLILTQTAWIAVR